MFSKYSLFCKIYFIQPPDVYEGPNSRKLSEFKKEVYQRLVDLEESELNNKKKSIVWL